MRLLDRYLLRELLSPLGYCLSGFLLFWVFADLFNEFRRFTEERLSAREIAAYYTLVAPEFLVVVLPVALLLALLYTLTNHVRHNEITAIRAAGVGLWRLSIPYLSVGLLASLVLFALNELWVPGSADAADQIRKRYRLPTPGAPTRDQVANLGFINSRAGRRWQIALYNLKTGEMRQVQVFSTLPDSSTRWLAAERAMRIDGVWTFYNVSEQTEQPGTNSFLIPSPHAEVRIMPEFDETPEQIRSEVKLSRSRALRTARKADLPISEILNYLRLHPQPEHPEDRDWLYTKLHGRLAAPWTCLVVVLIAIPFAVASGRRNVFVGVASSILICFVFFVLQQIGLALGTGGWVAPWLAAWFPNISFATVGLWMTSRVR